MHRVLFFISCCFTFILQAQDKPNFVWIMSEDNSIHYYDAYFKGGAVTPHINALAEEGLLFEHAFSNGPVCSVARTTLITSCYAPRIAAQYHRKARAVPMPEGLHFFPAYLKQAGYYTTNASKTDYNAEIGDVSPWDKMTKGHWRGRAQEQPFFAKFTQGHSHEGSLFKNIENPQHDPDKITVWPYFPDRDVFRRTHASYHDRMMKNDEYVNTIMEQLKKDGLLENTFVFYFGDHGGVMARSKGYLYETGLHVPFIVRIPENFKHLVDAERGSKVKGFVEFVDFGPTLLKLAGLDIPEGVDGKAFLGEGVSMQEVNTRDETFSYADRFDEKYELCRALRKGKFKYKRNYEGYLPDGLMNNYRYRQAAWQEWLRLFKDGKLNEQQRKFFEAKPPEELYDIESDPHELQNLAGDVAHSDTLLTLRKRLQQRLKAMPDLSFYPETFVVSDAVAKNPSAYGQVHKEEIASLIDTADLALLPFVEAKENLQEALESDNPWSRYWALTAASNFGTRAKELVPAIQLLLKDEVLLNQVRAAEFLAINGVHTQAEIRRALNASADYTETVSILNTIVYLRDYQGLAFDFSKADVNQHKGWINDRLTYLGWK